MEVTEVRVFLAEEEDERLKAYATVTFDNCFVVRDLKIISGNTGLFVAMPSKKRKDGTYKDVAHPIHSDFRQSLEQTVLGKYDDEIKSIAAGVKPIADRGIERVSTLQLDDEIASPTLYGVAAMEFETGIAPTAKKA
jgi:stage V sporulation protein G